MPNDSHSMKIILGFYFLCPTSLSIYQGSSKPRAHITAMNLKKTGPKKLTWRE